MGLCYCHTCNKAIGSLGIAAHKSRKEKCVIEYSNGDTYTHDYTVEKKGSPK